MTNEYEDGMMAPAIIFLPPDADTLNIKVETADTIYEYGLCRGQIDEARAFADGLCENAFVDIYVHPDYYDHAPCHVCDSETEDFSEALKHVHEINYNKKHPPTKENKVESPPHLPDSVIKEYTKNKNAIKYLKDDDDDPEFVKALKRYFDMKAAQEEDITENDEDLDEIFDYYKDELESIMEDFKFSVECFYSELAELLKLMKK